MNNQGNENVSIPNNENLSNQGMTHFSQTGMYTEAGVTNFSSTPKPKIGKKKLAIILGVILVVVLAIFLICKIFAKKNSYTFDTLTDTEAFFIKNEEGEYALFNEDGKQLSDFIFDYTGSFYGGVAKVSNKDGQYAIIKEDGSYLVEFSDQYIFSYGPFFELSTDSLLSNRLINYTGKTILEGVDFSVDHYSDYSFLVISLADSSLQVMNYKGEIMDTLPKGSYDWASEYVEGYKTLIGNSKTYLYDVEKGKKLLEIDGEYLISSALGDTIVLASYNDLTTGSYKIVKNKKVQYTVSKDTCSSISITENGELVCMSKEDYSYHFLESDGTVRSQAMVAYHSSKNYIVEAENGLTFYDNGKEAQTVSCVSFSSLTEDGYILSNRTSGNCRNQESGYTYYSTSGDKLSATYYRAADFDENGYAIVREDYYNTYLIDKSYTRVSNEYESVSAVGNCYVAKDEDGNYLLLNSKLEVLEKGFNKYRSSYRNSNKDAFAAITYDDKVVLYNVTTGKKVKEYGDKTIEFSGHYFKIDNSYYSYKTGEAFYTEG